VAAVPRDTSLTLLRIIKNNSLVHRAHARTRCYCA
jgi:hypothetical protein